jgi:peptide/nickel transport system substrate-binding protein
MKRARHAVAAALGLVVAMMVAACAGGSAAGSAAPGPPARGGTLFLYSFGPVASWDPQRMYDPAVTSFAGRVFERTLTTFPAGTSKDQQSRLVPDLATDTGTMSDGGRTWRFTLRKDAAWQDGRPVTCEDVKYGISRTFASDVITGGPGYAVLYLDIPKKADGSSMYLGPYKRTGQDLFDKAVTCAGQTITFRMNQPFTDFNEAVSLPAFGPYRQDKDLGARSGRQVFSNGPYVLQGSWKADRGGTFVRNPHWQASSDPVRRAYPDQISYREGVGAESAVPRIMSDSGDDRYAVTQDSAPPALQVQIASNPSVRSRATGPLAPYVDYLAPNFRSRVMANAKARQAFAMSTDRTAYVNAYGGSAAADPTYAIINKPLPAYHDFNPFNVPPEGDAAAARKVLQSSGLQLPVPITVTYRKGSMADKAFAALQGGWQQAGFAVKLDPIANQYYATIQKAQYATTSDVFWAGWRPDWPSGSTVIPPLFDGRVNITPAGSGQDYGYFNDPGVNARIDSTSNMTDPTAREKAWGDLDEAIAKLGGHVSLANQKFTFVHGSGVKNYTDNLELGGYVDLAQVAVR